MSKQIKEMHRRNKELLQQQENQEDNLGDALDLLFVTALYLLAQTLGFIIILP